MKTIILIPSRLASTRLPNKPLADINGKTMIQRVYEQALKTNFAENSNEIFIATDSQIIAEEIKKFNGKFIMTNPELPSGTDRIFSAYKILNKDFDIIVNVQGDLPNIDPKVIDDCIELAKNNPCDIATVASIIKDKTEINNPNVVKIALGQSGNALYFSRSPIPFSKNNDADFLHHIGIYAFKKNALEKFVNLAPSPLEKRESLEQLRALENNLKIAVKIVNTHPLSVDTLDDLEKISNLIKQNENH
ncbi:MAG: 3-deoxy-manno-octulosonate cytidylyltransferase [Proteobacteria bacterium]|nr:3-deoxy-manno-octulosonate cytidylyltransferase [Pseudomonadota bacterium]